MNSNTLRQWLGTLALIVIATALIVGVMLLASPAPAPKPAASSGIGLKSISSSTNFSSLQIDNDTAAAPGYSYTNDPDTGLYRVGANNVGLVAGATKAFDCTATSCTSDVALTHALNPIMPSESITPTNNGTVTPTMRLVTLTPASDVTITLGACTTGQQMILYDSVNFAIIITDTGNFTGAGNQTFGQYDAMPASCFGSKWVQTGAVSAN